jgi:hypothetical protein
LQIDAGWCEKPRFFRGFLPFLDAEHLQVALNHINRNAQNRRLAYENILWALIKTKEFMFNRCSLVQNTLT